ncbi:MAG: hypothetical protein D6780_01270, partial [Candidatus Dadabacteria bacterium]
FGIELAANLAISGSLDKPLINGKIETLRGWLSIFRNNFEVISGQLTFTPPLLTPSVSLLAESTVRTINGERIVVFLEVSGTTDNPSILLTSDRGYSHDELLNLLSSGGLYTGENTEEGGRSKLFLSTSKPLFESRSLKSFFRQIISLDTFSIGPVFSIEKGTASPAVTVKKQIFKDLTLYGHSFLQSSAGEARAALRYRASPRLALEASALSLTTEQNVAFQQDIIYRVLSQESRGAKVSFEGNSAFTRKELLSYLRLSQEAVLLPRYVASLVNTLKELYLDKGYFDVKVDGVCIKDKFNRCGLVKFKIKEGSRYLVYKTVIKGEVPKKVLEKI